MFLVMFRFLKRLQKIYYMRGTTCSTLSHNLKGLYHYIGTLDGNNNGNIQVNIANVITITPKNGGTCSNINIFFSYETTMLSTILFHNRGNDHGCFVTINEDIH